jgi:hypothetical protein
MISFLFYCLYMFFAFYIGNHSPLTEELRQEWLPRFPHWMAYSYSCAFCFTFWVGLALNFFGPFNPIVFAAPPVVLFINLAFERLKK